MAKERRFINQLMPGETVDMVFLVRDKDLRTTKSGDLYITCTLCDKTGALPARMWQANEPVYNGIPIDGFIQVRGRSEDYRGNLQLIVDSCRPVATEKVDLADFLATTSRDVEEMWEELLEILRAVKNEHVKLLLKKFFEDRELVAAFKRAPAAMQLHHPFIG